MAVNIGPKIGVDGETEYRRLMNNIIQQAKTLGSEMKAVTAAFDKNDKSQKKSSAQAQVLTKQIEVQKERIFMLKQGLMEAAQKYGEADTKTLKWKQAVNDATTELNSMERELENLGKDVDDVGDSMGESGQSALSLGDMIKANVISDVIISGMHEVADAAKKIGSALVGVGKDALDSYSDYEQLTGGIKKLFGDAYDQVVADSSKAYKEAGMSANDYMETATSFSASLIAGLSGDTQKAASLTNQAIKDMSDNANTFGTDISSIQNAYQGFAKQNYTMLDNLKLGYGGTQAEMARLINDSGVLGKTMQVTASTVNEVSFDKIIEAIHVMQERMNIAGTTSREASGTIEGSVNSMKAAWQNLLTAFAADDLDLSTYVNNFADSVKDAASNVVPRIMVIVPKLAEGMGQLADAALAELPNILTQSVSALPELTKAGVTLVAKLGQGIVQAYPQLKQAAGSMFQELIQNLKTNLPQMITTGLQAMTSFSGGLRENAGQLVDSAIVLVKTLADGMIKSLPQLISQIPTIVSNIAGIINDNAPKLLLAAGQLIVQLVKGLIENIPVIVANLPKIVQAIVDVITAVNWISLGDKIITGIADGIKGMAVKVASAVKEALNNPIQYLKGLVADFKSFGQNLISYLSSGVSGMASSISGAVRGVMTSAIDYLKSLPGEAVQWGKDFIGGLAGGIISAANSVINAVKNIGNKIRSNLHFSRPDEGPLRDYETWMPDFIDGMAEGIYRNAYKLQNAVMSLTEGMNINVTGQASAVGAAGGSYVINVYAARGMNEQQLADAVMQRIQHQVRQRETVYG
nr:MAG TPA: tail tape measure protein [Caudoviricetes sp.]